MKKLGIVRFPGTNCDRDTWKAGEQSGFAPEWLFHLNRFDSKGYAAIVIPGGFSYGDYLRAGALAARSPVMEDVRAAAQSGVPVLGICNGFQILCESGLLPGALVKNESLRFIDDWVELKMINKSNAWASHYNSGDKIKLPIAHGMGRYYSEEDEIKKLFDNDDQVWWTYTKNPNGALHDIAGIKNEAGNVAALMPHPERAMVEWMGGADGRWFFK
jgi:phosphoribosylformylglycinamidine synthase subunit PurQ / glutaminase